MEPSFGGSGRLEVGRWAVRGDSRPKSHKIEVIVGGGPQSISREANILKMS